MILYHVITSYHLLNAVVHAKKQNDRKILICSEWVLQKFPNNSYLECIFDRVLILDASYRFFHSKEETIEYFTNSLGNLNGYSEIFVWGAQFSFGITLAEQKIDFVFCEEGCGILSRSYILRDIEKGLPLKSKFLNLVDEYGLYDGSCVSVTKILCNKRAQLDNFVFKNNIIDFDTVDEIFQLDVNDKYELLNYFGVCKTINIIGNSALLLTQHFSNLYVLSFDEHVWIYQMFVDYFLQSKNLVIKAHPDDLMYYDALFPNAVIIYDKFPAEFIPFVFDVQPSMIATIGSTATFSLKGHYENIFELDSRYERDFYFTNKYYATVCIAKILNKNISCLFTNEILLQKLADTVGLPNIVCESFADNSDRENVLVVDNVTDKGEGGRQEIINILENSADNALVIFINSKKDYCWYDYYHRELWNDIIPVVLKKEIHQPQREDFYADAEDEVIYVYSKNKELLNMVREMELEKDLHHTGITVRKEILTAEQERIKMLEGILEATEKRLLYYINKEKEQ